MVTKDELIEHVDDLATVCERQAAEIAELRAERDQWNADARRLSGGLIAISESPKTIGSSVLRSIAYDIALNCIEPDTARFQILGTGRFRPLANSKPASEG